MSAYRIHVKMEAHATIGRTDTSVHVCQAMRVYIVTWTWPCAILPVCDNHLFKYLISNTFAMSEDEHAEFFHLLCQQEVETNVTMAACVWRDED